MNVSLFEPHPVTGYRFVPGLRARVPHEGGGYDVQCNAAGFRCRHEPTREKPPGTFRMIVLGDGQTAGIGVDETDRFTERLERRLGRYVQVLNFGLPGAGVDQQLLVFRHHARDIEHDLLLLCPQVENILRNLEDHAPVPSTDPQADPANPRRLPKPRFVLEDQTLVLHPSPTDEDGPPAASGPRDAPGLVRGLLRRVTEEVDRKVPGFHAFSRRVRGVGYPPEYDDPANPAWQLLRAICSTLVAEARSPVVLAPIPTFEHVDGGLSPDAYLTRFGELAVDSGCPMVNLLPRFYDEPRAVRGHARFEHDAHATAQGHAMFAEGLLPHLRAYVNE
ncbi:MAG: hypothetical protein K0V04_18555 [Deltaproteobacteria bacterium]|nr:hypothetical protein [Deltaproteobacteria bacterium]